MRGWLVLLAFCLTGCASLQREHGAIAADGVSTSIGLAAGGVEIGAGWASLPIRLAMIEHAKTLPPHEAKPILDAMNAAGWGAAANNVLVALGAWPVSFFIGGAVGLWLWSEGAATRDALTACAIHSHLAGKTLACNVT